MSMRINQTREQNAIRIRVINIVLNPPQPRLHRLQRTNRHDPPISNRDRISRGPPRIHRANLTCRKHPNTVHGHPHLVTRNHSDPPVPPHWPTLTTSPATGPLPSHRYGPNAEIRLSSLSADGRPKGTSCTGPAQNNGSNSPATPRAIGTSDRWQRAWHPTHNRDHERSSLRRITGEVCGLGPVDGHRIITISEDLCDTPRVGQIQDRRQESTSPGVCHRSDLTRPEKLKAPVSAANCLNGSVRANQVRDVTVVVPHVLTFPNDPTGALGCVFSRHD